MRGDLIAQAEEARRAGDHARAVDRALRAARIRATASIQYFLAREHEALGQSLATLEQAGACACAAEADPALHNRDVLLRACRAIVARTEGRLGRLTVRVAGPLAEGATITVAGHPLGPTVLGSPYPVEPGVVHVEASAPGCAPWQREVTVVAGAAIDVVVSLEPTPAPPPPPAPLVVARPPPVAPRRPPDARPSRPALPLVVGLAAGGVSIAAAGVLYALGLGARSDRDGACRGAPPVCGPGASDDNDRYRGFLYATDVALGLGAASLVVGGLVWWFARRPEGPRVVVLPTLEGRGATGATLTISM